MASSIFRSFLYSSKKFSLPVRMLSNSAPIMPNLSPEQISKIAESDKHLRTKHLEIEGNLNPTERDIARRKRMIYRSKQRGWLEADILMGSWASENVPKLSDSLLDEYDIVLKEETIDVFNYITGKDPLPEHLKGLKVMKLLQDYAMDSKLHTPTMYENIKRRNNLT